MGKNWNNPKAAANGKRGGRPVASSTLQSQLFRTTLAKLINDNAKAWHTAIQDAALGHYVEVKGPDGTVKVYKKAPDPTAWEKATSRAFGKPPQDLDLKSDGEKLEGAVIQIIAPDNK